jgi:hypothetical protein
MSDAVGSIFAAIILWTIAFVFGFLTTTYQAFVFGQIWEWFIVPAGYGFEPLPFSFRLGAILLLNLLLVNIGVLISMNASGNNESGSAHALVGQLAVVIVTSMAWAGAAIWTLFV